MKQLYFILIFIFSSHFSFSQKIIHNPDFVSQNIGTITKVELTETETIIHIYIKAKLGSWVAIPRETYIEDSSGKSKRIFITRTEGISLTGKNYFEKSDEKRFKVIFPSLGKNIENINYGESNKNGNWFIYKLDLTKDGKDFISNKKNGLQENIKEQLESDLFKKIKNINENINTNISSDLNLKTILPSDLPPSLFGNWYDKHETLIMILTKDYIVFDNRIKYYKNIKSIGNNKFKIETSSNNFEILDLNNQSITIRTNRLMILKKKKNNIKKTPFSLTGEWLHWDKVKEIKVTEDYFYNNDKHYHGFKKDIVENKIDHIAESNNGNIMWFVLYNQGKYHLYYINKTDEGFVLHARGYSGARYYKTK